MLGNSVLCNKKTKDYNFWCHFLCYASICSRPGINTALIVFVLSQANAGYILVSVYCSLNALHRQDKEGLLRGANGVGSLRQLAELEFSCNMYKAA